MSLSDANKIIKSALGFNFDRPGFAGIFIRVFNPKPAAQWEGADDGVSADCY